MKSMIFGAMIALFFQNTWVSAADLEALKSFYKDRAQSIYKPRYCGQNVYEFAKQAAAAKIDIRGSYALKFVGGGFLETSGFYTLQAPQERAMLGYFHWVWVAEGHVFDFDLNERLVLPVYEYLRLQFTPPYEPFYVFGNMYDSRKELSDWVVTRTETPALLSRDQGGASWSKKVSEWIDLNTLMRTQRVR